MLILTFIGSWKFVAPTVVVLILVLLLRRAQREAALLALAVGGSAALNVGLKFFFHRMRPSVPWALTHEQSFSFPSGHAVAASCFYATITYLLARRRQVRARTALVLIAISIVLGIGLSRVYLGVHYPSDIAAGYLVGILWVGTVILAFHYLEHSD
jgi:undecaprenyl-diphosphatase